MLFNLIQEEGNNSIIRLVELFLKETATCLLKSESKYIATDDFKLLILILAFFELVNNLAYKFFILVSAKMKNIWSFTSTTTTVTRHHSSTKGWRIVWFNFKVWHYLVVYLGRGSYAWMGTSWRVAQFLWDKDWTLFHIWSIFVSMGWSSCGWVCSTTSKRGFGLLLRMKALWLIGIEYLPLLLRLGLMV